MLPASFSFHYPDPKAVGDPALALCEALREGAQDRASTARTLAAETAEGLRAWARSTARSVPAEELGACVAAGLAPWRAIHGWRAPCGRLCEALDLLFTTSPAEQVRALLDAELEAWVTPGERMPSRREVCAAAVARLGRGETLLVHGFSETVAVACEAAAAAGLDFGVLLGEGTPDFGGQRMARRLSAAGLGVRLVHDAALTGCVAEVDRLWMGAESIAPGCFVARAGACSLLEEARRQEVPGAVLATVDKLAPGGEALLPAWCDAEPWLLWHDAPPGVVVERQLYERVPLGLVEEWLTEVGLERPADLFIRGLAASSNRHATAPPTPTRA
ncbi:MAG: hypothetical protein QGI46_01280 [Planctomycetota bacterium]|jgi:translation initiation factor 2B subunit (eIF-2B alpha/beta/delta family)|nr:hypothetical protein [Planctomycetota bacterium]